MSVRDRSLTGDRISPRRPTKREHQGVTTVLGWILLLLLAISSSFLRAQVSEEELAQALEMLGQVLGLPGLTTEELKGKVEELGGLHFIRDVPVDFMTREDLAGYLRDVFDEEYPVEVAEREEKGLRALGFLGPDEDLRALRERVLNENVIGFYDERSGVKKLFAVSSGTKLNVMNQLVLSHELRHALQDQHVNVEQALGDGSDFDDGKLAVLSLLEGDASLLMEKYLASGGSPRSDSVPDLLSGLGAGVLDTASLAEVFAGPELRAAPPVVRDQLLVPYLEGRNLAAEIYRRGGFELLNEKLRRPPRSMEQVLHPEKYLDGVDEPIEVALPQDASGDLESEGRVGEMLARSLLEAVLPRQQSLEAAAGWGGDRYGLWVEEDGSHRIIWRTVWDTEADTTEFFDALVRFASIGLARGPTPAAGSDTVRLDGRDGSRVLISREGLWVTLEREGFR